MHVCFARQFPVLCFWIQNIPGQRAGRAAGHPLRRPNETIRADHDFSGTQEAPLFIDGHRATMLPGPARIRHIAKAVNDQRKFTFEHFGWNRSVRPKGHGGHAINSVLVRPSTPATKENIHHRKRRPVFFFASEVQHVPALSRDRHPVRQRLCQSPKQHIENTKE